VNGVANAFLDKVPMIAISGQIAGRREALFTHQIIDHNRVFSPVSKWTVAIRADNVAEIMRRAFRVAMAERPGPAHLTLAGDVVAADAGTPDISLPPMDEAAGASEVYGLATPRDLLAAARRPILLAGTTVVRQRGTKALVALAEKIGAPVVVAPMAKGVFPETHPLYAGTIDMACNQLMWKFLKSADLVVCAGFDAVELIKPWSVTAPTLFIDSTANTDQVIPAAVEAIGCVPRILEALAAGFVGEPRWRDSDVARHRAELARAFEEGRVAGRLNPSDVIRVARACAPKETVVTTDVGSHKLLVGQGWTTHEPRGVLMTNGLSSMGFSLPAAIVAKKLLPERPVICFVGDGGLAMVQGELGLAAALKLDLVVVVFCDQSLNRIELKQMVRNLPSVGTRIERTDIGKLAEAMGCDGLHVDSESKLADALSARRSGDRPLVIGADIEPGQYLSQF
jgi:acetolactate synthase-1/2/3 large subunit